MGETPHGPSDGVLFISGLLLCIFGAVFIALIGVFSVNCDSTICQIPASIENQITTTYYALWIPVIFLFLIGLLMITASKKPKIAEGLGIGQTGPSRYITNMWSTCLFQLSSMTLLFSSIYLYSIIKSDNFVCDIDRKTTLLHCLTGMITMSSGLFLYSMYVLYDFWKETDEQKLQNAKNAIDEFKKIKSRIPDGDGNQKTTEKIEEFRKAIEKADGLGETTVENIEFKESLGELDAFIEKNYIKKEALSEKLKSVELDRLTGSRKKEMELALSDKLKEFNTLPDDQKIKFICDNKKDLQLYEKLKQTEFYIKFDKFNQNKFDICTQDGKAAYDKDKQIEDSLRKRWEILKDTIKFRVYNEENKYNPDLLEFIDDICKKNKNGIFNKEELYDLNKLGLAKFHELCGDLQEDKRSILSKIKESHNFLKQKEKESQNFLKQKKNDNNPKKDETYSQPGLPKYKEVQPGYDEDRQKSTLPFIISDEKEREYCSNIVSAIGKMEKDDDKLDFLCRNIDDPATGLKQDEIINCYKTIEFVKTKHIDIKQNCARLKMNDKKQVEYAIL